MSNQLTFGIEYEIKLRITKAQLRAELDSRDSTRHLQIIASPGPVRLLNVGPEYLKNDYVNFALHDPNQETCLPQTVLVEKNSAGKLSPYRGYSDEILRVIQKRLKVLPGYETTTVHTGQGAKRLDFSAAKLHLTTDASLNGLTADKKLLSGVCAPQDVADTDFAGAEIVTAPRTSPEAASEEAGIVSKALRSDGLDFIVDDETAMHVHVGREDGTPFPVEVLTALALLCVVFEHEISAFTVPRKRGTDFETRSNRDDFVAETPLPQKKNRFVCDAQGVVTEEEIDVVWVYESIAEIQKRFEDVLAAENPRSAFKALVGAQRNRIVSFAYCDRDVTDGEGAATVEFRQHAGSLSEESTLHWSRFCLGLVSLAQKHAEKGQSVKIASWDDEICIEELWREMRLPETTRVYFRDRREGFEVGEGVTSLWERADEEDFFFDGESQDGDGEFAMEEPDMTEVLWSDEEEEKAL